MTELDTLGITTVFTADAALQVLPLAAAQLHRHLQPVEKPEAEQIKPAAGA